MYTYWMLILFVFLLFHVLVHGKIIQKNIYTIIILGMLLTMSTLRASTVGGDLQHYLPNFYWIGRKSFTEIFLDRTKYGYIYSLICKFTYIINQTNLAFLFSTSIVNLFLVTWFIRKHSCNLWMSFFLYITFGFYTNTFNSIRSSMAVGIGLMMYDFILKRRFMPFFLLYLVALEIHQTFFPFIFLYFIYNIKLTYKYIICTIGFSFIISQISRYVSFISTMAYAYDEGAYSDIGDSYTGGYNMLFILIFITILTFSYSKGNMSNMNKLYIHSLVFASCIQCFATYYQVLNRVSLFFYICLIVFIPNLLKTILNKQLQFIATYGVTILMIIFFNIKIMTPTKQFGNNNYQSTIPYKTFWEK